MASNSDPPSKKPKPDNPSNPRRTLDRLKAPFTLSWSQQSTGPPVPGDNSPTSIPYGGSTQIIATTGSAHQLASSHVPIQQASASLSNLAIDTPSSVNPAIADTLDPTTHAMEIVQPDPQTQHRSRSSTFDMTTLKVALRALDKTARLFPPLQPSIEILQSCLERVQSSEDNTQGHDDLTSELNNLNEVLEKHSYELEFTRMSACITNVVESINEEVRKLKKRKGGLLTGIVKAHADADELTQCIHRVQKFLRLLKVDVSLSTWSIANEHLANTRLEGLSPVKVAAYNSALPEDASIARRTCTEGTRTEILYGLNSWSNDHEGSMVYWMNGMAGTGKTTIACSLSAALAKRKQLGASFFCTRTLPHCRDVRRIVPTIAYQLARYSRSFQFALCKELEQEPDIATQLLSTQFERLLKKPLVDVKDAVPSNVVVIIDALDECGDSIGVQTFLKELLRVAPDLPVKFFISSRPEPGISDKISPKTIGPRSILYLHDIERSLVQADIELYLTEELAPISASEAQIKQLAQLSGNLFIYAATAVRYIQPDGSNTMIDPQERLEAVLSLDSGSTMRNQELDLLYTTILTRVLHEKLEAKELERGRLVLWTSVCAREPVTVETLAALAGLGIKITRAMIQSLRSVLHIPESSGLVSTLHASFPEFIFAQERSKQFFCQESSHARLLARQCFKVMQDELRFNICKLGSSFVLDMHITDLEKRVSEHISRKLSYVCQYWGDHLSLAAPANDLCSLLEDFLSNRLLFWLEVLNLSRSNTLGKFILQNIRSWLAPFNDPALPDIMRLTSDSLDFATMLSSNPVMLSTPHIYISLLPFCHKSSLVFKHYCEQVQGLLDVNGTAMGRPGSVALASYDVGTPISSIAVSPDGSTIAFGGGDENGGMVGSISQQNGKFVVRPFKGHDSLTTSVAFSPDGTRIATGSDDMTICVWNSKDGSLAVGPVKGHTAGVTSVAFSPDGTRIVSGSGDTTICVWDAQDGTIAVSTFQAHTRSDTTASFLFDSDGTCAFSGANGLTICVYERDGEISFALLQTPSVKSVAYSLDGTRILSCSWDGIRMWNAQDGELLAGPFQGSDDFTCVALSPCSTRIIAGSLDSTICVLNAEDGNIAAGPLKAHTFPVGSVACSPDGTRIASGSESTDNTICVWSAQDGKLLTSPLRGHTRSITSVAFSPDSAHIISGSEDRTIRTWNARDNDLVTSRFGGNTGWAASAAFSPDRTRVVFGSSDGTISVWDAQDGGLMAGPSKGHTSYIDSVAFSPDGTRIVSGSRDNTICLWDTNYGTLVAGPITGHTEGVMSVAFSPDSTHVISGSADKTICVWNAQDGKLVAGPFTDPDSSGITSAVFSPDGTQIVSSSSQGAICVRNLHDGQIVTSPLKGHTGRVWSVAFSPDGTRIVSGSEDGTICLWHAKDGTLAIGPLKGHTKRVTSMAFSPDSTHLVSGSDDMTICVWRVQDGNLVAGPFKGHTAWIKSVAFSTEEGHILSVADNCCVHSTKFQNIAMSTTSLQADWDVEDSGWVINSDGQHLFWVPPQIRPFLPRPYTSYVICPEGTFRVDYADKKLLLDDKWHQCYIGS